MGDLGYQRAVRAVLIISLGKLVSGAAPNCLDGKMKRKFAPLGTWAAANGGRAENLRDRDLGAWHGRWLMGVNGPRLGRFELAFENGARQRTLLRSHHGLFWAFEYHRAGFPTRLDEEPIRANWREQRRKGARPRGR